MAVKQIMLDDLDGTELPEERNGTVRFSVQGRSFEIDLSEANERKLLDALQPFMEKAREVRSAPTVPSGTASAGENTDEEKPYDLREARKWLREQGYELNQVGPLKAEFRKIYEDAHDLPPWK